jgi:hypothetical protein
VSIHVFDDESRRGGTYLVAAAVVPPGRLDRLRCLVRNLLLPGERRIHFQAENDSRRRKILGEFVTHGARAQIYLGCGRPDRVRAVCLERLLDDVISWDTRRLVIESRGEADATDRALIHRMLTRYESVRERMSYEHLLPHDDPCLAIPDAVAWAYGAGSDWRRRVAPTVIEVVNLGVVVRPRKARSPGSRRPAGLPGLTSST